MIAHSKDIERNIPEQPYEDHVNGVWNRISYKLGLFSYDPNWYKLLQYVTLYHDIGKLDEQAQEVLSGNSSESMINHTEAGVVISLEKYEETKNKFYLYAAWLIKSHHKGLKDQSDMFAIEREHSFMSFKETTRILDGFKDLEINDYVKSRVKYYQLLSKKILPDFHRQTETVPVIKDEYSAVDLRMLLSLFVDGDHYDTSSHYGLKIQTGQRLLVEGDIEKLDSHVSNLSNNARKTKRQRLRDTFFEECGRAKYEELNLIDGTVGVGKTFGALRLALRIAKDKNLDRVFTILPYINIISQTVKEYRSALGIPGGYYVNEIHSKCEYGNYYTRKYSRLWEAPINVSTAVQFFEMLASNHTTTLRKMHNIVNSVVILDEYHTAIPSVLYGVTLDIIRELSEKFNVHWIFSSGTPIPFWDIIPNTNLSVHNVLRPNIYSEQSKNEKTRVNSVRFKNDFDSVKALCAGIKKESKNQKSALVVCNTIATAYLIFKELRKSCKKVYNISSAITPEDREELLEEIRESLDKREKIYVVSTTIIECGVDISFDIGFREECPVASLVQFSGRINREQRKKTSFVYVFRFSKQVFSEEGIGRNPSMSREISISSKYMTGAEPKHCSEVAEVVLTLEKNRVEAVRDLNDKLCFDKLNNKYRVIEGETITILVDKALEKEIIAGNNINFTELGRKSVQLVYSKKREEIIMQNVKKHGDFLFYRGYYNKKDGGLARILVE